MKIEIFTKKQIETVIKKELDLRDREIYKHLEKLRERFNDLEHMTKYFIRKEEREDESI